MKVLLVTGRLAEAAVRDAVERVKGVEVDVRVLDYPVAALMTAKYVAEKLKGVRGYDYIVVPGMMFGDASIVERVTGVKTVKGSEDAYDIPLVLEAIRSGVELSPMESADRVIERMRLNDIRREMDEMEKNGNFAFDQEGLNIPLRPPPFRLFLELDVNWNEERVNEEVERVRSYVDVIVVGTPAGSEDQENVMRRIRKLRDMGVKVGIDSSSPKEIVAGVKAGAEFVFNMNEENIDSMEEVKDATVVIAPMQTTERAERCIEIAKAAKARGFRKLIVDPVLSPPLLGTFDSLQQYWRIRRELPDVPALMGVLNVTELIDADSHGVNALMASIAMELGVGNLLTMDKGRTKWSSWELRTATTMVSIAWKRKKPPKDLGVDLLILKDRRRGKEEPLPADRVVEIGEVEPNMDRGFVKIGIEGGKLAISYNRGERVKLLGKDPLSLGRALVRETPLDPEHSLYVGYELAKAEIAAQLDKTYVQDAPLFKVRRS